MDFLQPLRQLVRSFTSQPRRPVSDRPRWFVALLIFLLLFCWSAAKGLVPVWYVDELYFWLNSYQHGFVRRGLVGSMISPLLHQPTPQSVAELALRVHFLCLVGIIALTAIIVVRLVRRGSCSALGVGMIFAASPFVSLIVNRAGSPDALISLALIICAVMLPVANVLAIVSLAVICAITHELIFFLLIPMILFLVAIKRDLTRLDNLLIFISIIISAIFISHGAHNAAGDANLTQELVRSGLSSNEAQIQTSEYLHQGTFFAIHSMRNIWEKYFLNGIIAVSYFSISSFLIMILGSPDLFYTVKMRGFTYPYQIIIFLLYSLSCLSGIGILIIASDAGRISAFTTLTSFLTVTCLLDQSRAQVSSWLKALAGVVIATFIALPACLLNFNYGRELNVENIYRVCSPCAGAGLAFIDFYNRDQPAEERIILDSDPLYGDRHRKFSDSKVP